MRIGNMIEVTSGPRVALATRTPTVNTEERGQPGNVSTWGGAITTDSEATDPNEVWRPPARWSTVTDMLTHPDIAAALDAIMLPVLAARPTIEPGTDDPVGREGGKWPAPTEVADFVAADFAAMSTGWFDRRYEALHGALTDGVAPFQKVYAYDKADGLYHLAKLAYRDPRTVTEWRIDANGGPAGIEQTIYPNGQREVHDFGIDELLLFIHRRKGTNIIGDSLLRAVYEPFLVSRTLSRAGGAAAERGAFGIPTMRARSRDAGYLARVDRLLAGLRSAARAFVRLEPDQEMTDFEIKGMSGQRVDTTPMMEFHRRSFYLRMLCPFLPLGTDGVGSLALSDTQASFFMKLLDFIMTMEEENYYNYLIRQWVGYNWSALPLASYPRVVIPRPRADDMQAWAAAVLAMVNAGIALDQSAVRAKAHELLDVPLPDEAPEAGEAASVPNPEAEGVAATDTRTEARAWPGVMLAGSGPLKSVVMFEALGIAPNFVRMAESLDGGRDKLAARLSGLQGKQAKRLRAKAAKIIASGDPDELEAFLADPASIPYAEERAAIEAELASLYVDGYREVGDEMAQQGVRADAPGRERTGRDKALLAVFALWAGRELASRMSAAFGAEVLGQLGARGGLDRAALDAALTGAPARLLADIAGRGVNTAMGLGRGATIDANAGALERVIRTAAMDQNTCGPCARYDGEEWPAADARPIPEPECEGGALCRCENVPVVKPSERGPAVDFAPEDLPW